MNLFLTSELLAQMDFYIAIVAPFSHQDFFDVEWRAFNIVRIYTTIRLYSKNVCLWPQKLRKHEWLPIRYFTFSYLQIQYVLEKKRKCIASKLKPLITNIDAFSFNNSLGN